MSGPSLKYCSVAATQNWVYLRVLRVVPALSDGFFSLPLVTVTRLLLLMNVLIEVKRFYYIFSRIILRKVTSIKIKCSRNFLFFHCVVTRFYIKTVSDWGLVGKLKGISTLLMYSMRSYSQERSRGGQIYILQLNARNVPCSSRDLKLIF